MYTLCTSKCASNHNAAHFFNMSTSKCAPSMWCFYHADLDICFVPQRRAMFHLWYRYLRSHKSLGQIVSRSSYLFEHLHLLSSDFLLLRSYPPLIFSLLTSFMPLLFHLSMLSEVRLLSFIFLPLPFCRCSWSSSFYRFTVLPFYRFTAALAPSCLLPFYGFTVLPVPLLHRAFYGFTVLPFYQCPCSTWPWSTLLFRYSTTPSLFYTEQPCFAGYKISFSLPLQLVCFVTTVLFRYRLSFLLQLVCFISTLFPWWQVPFFCYNVFFFSTVLRFRACMPFDAFTLSCPVWKVPTVCQVK